MKPRKKLDYYTNEEGGVTVKQENEGMPVAASFDIAQDGVKPYAAAKITSNMACAYNRTFGEGIDVQEDTKLYTQQQVDKLLAPKAKGTKPYTVGLRLEYSDGCDWITVNASNALIAQKKAITKWWNDVGDKDDKGVRELYVEYIFSIVNGFPQCIQNTYGFSSSDEQLEKM